MSTEATPLTAEDLAGWRTYAERQGQRDRPVVINPVEFVALLDRALATPPVPAGHVHHAEYPSACTGCEHLAADLASRLPPGLLPVPAGDERKRLAAIIHEPCVERWRHRGKVGYGVDTMHGIDAHYELADRLLAAGVRLTEGGK